MKTSALAFAIGLLLFMGIANIAERSTAQPPNPEMQEGVDVQTRGPMHEAYASPQSLNPAPSPIVPKQPPEPVPELPPDQKPEGSHVVWISGYWAWDDDPADFIWVSGFWRDVPPGKRWLPGHWSQVAGGFQWAPGFWADEQQSQVSYVPPPPPSLETGPSQIAPGPNQFYNPGTWIYTQQQYRWRPGFWLTHRANFVYIPAHFVWTPAGCIFVEGHWDYEITRRGLLFCPVRFTANVWTRPNWRLRNQYIVYPQLIVGSLFVRFNFHRYCFGDYFGASYLRHGFIPWVDYRLHKNIPEPLFHQYAFAHRTQVNWERDLRKLYDDRRLGNALRPPHTVVQQQQFLRDLTAHKAIKVGGKTFTFNDIKAAEHHLTMASTIGKVNPKIVPLKTLTPAAHADVLKTIQHQTTVSIERDKTTVNILKNAPPTRPTDAHIVGKVSTIPKHLQSPRTATRPPAPVIPKHVERVIPKYTPPPPPRLNTKPLPHAL